MERITAAAVVLTGRSHAEVYNNRGHDNPIEGFMTDKGRFIGREEALALAKQNGQLREEFAGTRWNGLRSFMVNL